MAIRNGWNGNVVHSDPLPCGSATAATTERPEAGDERVGRGGRRGDHDLVGEGGRRRTPGVARALELTDEPLERLRRDMDAVGREIERGGVDSVDVDSDRDRRRRERPGRDLGEARRAVEGVDD